MGEPHVKMDKILKPGESEQMQKAMNQHISAWVKMTDLGGGDWNYTKRFRETTIKKTANIPLLSLLVKEHKPVKEGEVPKVRLVVASQASMNLQFEKFIVRNP